MAKYVKEGTFGGYKEVPGGLSDPECSHVIMSLKEYNELHRRIAATEQESRNTKYEAEKRMQRLENDARYKVQAAEASAAQKVADMANADRKLKPKKEHTGYVVVASEEKEYRYRDGKKWKKAKLWETVLQSYYSVDFTEEEARTQIERDLFPKGEAWLIAEIGISGRYGGRYEGMIEDTSVSEDFLKHNILLAGQQRLRANFRSGYWELVFMHTKALGIVPPDMRVR